MNTIRKFTTFDELKSCDDNTAKYAHSLKKHNTFEKVIREIRSTKITKASKRKPKC